jgi:hypothetical protein
LPKTISLYLLEKVEIWHGQRKALNVVLTQQESMGGADMSASSGESRSCMGIPGGVIALLLILGGMIGTFAACAPPTGGSSGNATATAQAVATTRAQSNTTATAQAQLNATATVQVQATATAQAQTATATAVPSVMITSPKNNATVGSFITVHGTASNIPAGKELWLFVTEEGVSGYFPQLVGDAANPRPITIFSGGAWSIGVHIGQENDPAAVGKTFTLIPALIDQNDSSAHQAIKAFFQQTGEYHPIDPLPSGIQLLSQVQVVRT